MPDAYFIFFIASSILINFLFPIAKILFFPYTLVGSIVIASGLLMVFAANYLLLKKKTSIQALENPSQLVTTGPFKYSRNPIYLGMTVALFGVSITCGSLSPLLFPLFFVLILNSKFIAKEEQTLEKTFGAEYLYYKAKVRRWI